MAIQYQIQVSTCGRNADRYSWSLLQEVDGVFKVIEDGDGNYGGAAVACLDAEAALQRRRAQEKVSNSG